jgi:toxin ParE1/3/4
MGWRIVWSRFAENELTSIYNYYIENASTNIAQKLLMGIVNAPNIILKNPRIGQVEIDLLELSHEYRYILFKSYKIIYSLDTEKKQIRIADVFDTRQDPKKIKRNS